MKRTIHPLNGIGPVTTPGAKVQAARRAKCRDGRAQKATVNGTSFIRSMGRYDFLRMVTAIADFHADDMPYDNGDRITDEAAEHTGFIISCFYAQRFGTSVGGIETLESLQLDRQMSWERRWELTSAFYDTMTDL